MHSSLGLGRWFGIPVRVHWTFALLLLWIVGREMMRGSPAAYVTAWLVLILVVFGCVALHELGHALAARLFRIGTRDIILHPLGGVARLERAPMRSGEEIVIALAGPLVNLLIAIVVLGGLITLIQLGVLPAAVDQDGGVDITGPSGFTFIVAVLNGILFVFNLIPALPMDGGRVLRATLAFPLGRDRATHVAAVIGQGIAIGIAALAIAIGAPVGAILGAFIFMLARAEVANVRRRASMRTVTVAAAMAPEFESADGDETVEDVRARIGDGEATAIVVLGPGGEPAGIVTERELVGAIGAGGARDPVRDVAAPNPPIIDAGTPLVDAVRGLGDTSARLALVRNEGRIVGVITPEGVESALRSPR